MKRTGALILTAALFAAPAALAKRHRVHAPIRGCGITLEVGTTVQVRMLNCPISNPFPHVYVGNNQLLNLSLSDGGNTATYYGWGVVARLHQTGHRFTVRVVSVAGPRDVGVQLTRTCGDLCN